MFTTTEKLVAKVAADQVTLAHAPQALLNILEYKRQFDLEALDLATKYKLKDPENAGSREVQSLQERSTVLIQMVDELQQTLNEIKETFKYIPA